MRASIDACAYSLLQCASKVLVQRMQENHLQWFCTELDQCKAGVLQYKSFLGPAMGGYFEFCSSRSLFLSRHHLAQRLPCHLLLIWGLSSFHLFGISPVTHLTHSLLCATSSKYFAHCWVNIREFCCKPPIFVQTETL